MLETLFGSKNRERVLQFILANGEENDGLRFIFIT